MEAATNPSSTGDDERGGERRKSNRSLCHSASSHPNTISVTTDLLAFTDWRRTLCTFESGKNDSLHVQEKD